MGIVAKWTTTCAGCDKVVENEIVLSPETSDLHWNDIWGPGWPENWMQVSHDEVTDKYYLFFHSDECYEGWLAEQGRHEEVEKFREAVWMA